MNFSIHKWLTISRLTWLIVLVFLFLSAWLLWAFFKTSSVDSLTTSKQQLPLSAKINRNNIISSPYFGQYLPEDSRGIQPTSLDIELVGVLFSKNPADCLVIIKSSDGIEKYFHVDGELPGGAVIKKITENSVIILFNGRLEQLNLPKDKLIFEEKPKSDLIKESK